MAGKFPVFTVLAGLGGAALTYFSGIGGEGLLSYLLPLAAGGVAAAAAGYFSGEGAQLFARPNPTPITAPPVPNPLGPAPTVTVTPTPTVTPPPVTTPTVTPVPVLPVIRKPSETFTANAKPVKATNATASKVPDLSHGEQEGVTWDHSETVVVDFKGQPNNPRHTVLDNPGHRFSIFTKDATADLTATGNWRAFSPKGPMRLMFTEAELDSAVITRNVTYMGDTRKYTEIDMGGRKIMIEGDGSNVSIAVVPPEMQAQMIKSAAHFRDEWREVSINQQELVLINQRLNSLKEMPLIDFVQARARDASVGTPAVDAKPAPMTGSTPTTPTSVPMGATPPTTSVPGMP